MMRSQKSGENWKPDINVGILIETKGSTIFIKLMALKIAISALLAIFGKQTTILATSGLRKRSEIEIYNTKRELPITMSGKTTPVDNQFCRY